MFSQRVLKSFLLVLSAFCVLTFQNCSPPGDSAEVPSALNIDPNDPQAECKLPNYTSPSWNSAPSSININIGQGPDAPAITYNRSNYSFAAHSRSADKITVNCSENNPNISVNCNSSGIRVTPSSADVECQSGTVQVSMKLNDGCDGKSRPERIVNVTYNGSICPDMKTIAPSEAQTNAGFGTQVAMDGEYLAVSANGQDAQNTSALDNSGMVFVYRLQNGAWSQIANLNPANSGSMLSGVSIKGSNLVVGTSRNNNGLIYIYDISGNNVQLSQSINSPVASDMNGVYFGQIIHHISSTEFAIGAYGEDINGAIDAGAVYIYSKSGGAFSQSSKLTSNNPRATEYFGRSIASSGNALIVGAPIKGGFEDAQSNFGAVYKFINNSFERKISLSNPSSVMAFGSSVATDGTKIAVGAPVKDNSKGGVYIFDFANGGQLGNVIEANGLLNTDEFGYKVAFLNNSLYASMRTSNDQPSALFRFSFSGNTATQNYKLRAPRADRANHDVFGHDFKIANNRIAISSPAKSNSSLTNAGLAFVIGVPQ